MREEKLKEAVLAAISVTRQDVATAKGFILARDAKRMCVRDLLEDFLEGQRAPMPTRIEIDVTKPDVDDVLRELARALSLRLAAQEAVWALVHHGFLHITGEVTSDPNLNVSYLVGSCTNSIGFDELNIPYPREVVRSWSVSGDELLCEHDLFLRRLNVGNMGSGVEAALREAVECFASELYTACAAMLGSAAEGAWLEAGSALALFAEKHGRDVRKFRERLDDRNLSAAKKAKRVSEFYNQQDLMRDIETSSGISFAEFAAQLVWYGVVRDSRNAVHLEAVPAISNDREKLAVLLLEANSFFRTLYAVKAAAEA